MTQARLIQNENCKDSTLGIEGIDYEINSEGVLRCSENVANFLLATSGWIEYKRDHTQVLKTANQEVIDAEANFEGARRRLEKAKEDYEKAKVLVKDQAKEDEKPMEEVSSHKVEEEPEGDTGEEEEIPEDEIPTMKSTKAEMIKFCKKYGLDYDPKDSRPNLYGVISAAVE